MMEVALHIPDDVAKQMRRVNGQDIARHILEEYAIRAYQERTLGEVAPPALTRLCNPR